MFDKIRDASNHIETVIINTASRLGPILAPAPTAYLVGRATVNHLGWPMAVAAIAALVIECLGLASTATALTLWTYNQTKRKSDPTAPFVLAVVLVAAYFVLATGLTVLLDVYPDVARFSPAVFPTLSLCGVAILAIRGGHQRRLEAIEQGKQENRAKRQATKKSKAEAELELAKVKLAQTQQEQEHLERMAQIEAEKEQKELEAQQKRDRLASERAQRETERRQTLDRLGAKTRQTLDILATDPNQTQAEIAQTLGVTPQTAAYHLERLETLGLVTRDNGSIEVLVDLDDNGQEAN